MAHDAQSLFPPEQAPCLAVTRPDGKNKTPGIEWRRGFSRSGVRDRSTDHVPSALTRHYEIRVRPIPGMGAGQNYLHGDARERTGQPDKRGGGPSCAGRPSVSDKSESGPAKTEPFVATDTGSREEPRHQASPETAYAHEEIEACCERVATIPPGPIVHRPDCPRFRACETPWPGASPVGPAGFQPVGKPVTGKMPASPTAKMAMLQLRLAGRAPTGVAVRQDRRLPPASNGRRGPPILHCSRWDWLREPSPVSPPDVPRARGPDRGFSPSPAGAGYRARGRCR